MIVGKEEPPVSPLVEGTPSGGQFALQKQASDSLIWGKVRCVRDCLRVMNYARLPWKVGR